MRWNSGERDGARWAENVRVTKNWRDMSIVSLAADSVVTFSDGDGEDVELLVRGENGRLLHVGDAGVLTCEDGRFSTFAKENGEVVSELFVLPAEQGEPHE